jgi:hypothetical protein
MMESKLSDTPNAREATSKVFKTAAPGSAGTDEVCCESASNCDPGSNCGKSLTGKLFAGNWWGHDWTPIKSCKKIDS